MVVQLTTSSRILKDHFDRLALNLTLTFVEKSIHKLTLSYRGENYKAKYLKGSKHCFELARFRVIRVQVIGVKITVNI